MLSGDLFSPVSRLPYPVSHLANIPTIPGFHYDGAMFGSHLSIAGGLSNALREAESLGLDTVQIFTKNQRQWAVKPLDEAIADEWVAEQSRLGWEGRTVAHDSYLINLASPDDALWEKSINAMRDEIERCERLRIRRLVSHPGAHTGSGEEAGLRRIAVAYKRLLRDTRGYRTKVCLEDTAGGGSTLGRTFEELATLRDMIFEEAGPDAEGRIGFCLDTCHALAAGYDVTSEKKTLAVIEEFDRVCGLEWLAAVHLNDSKGALGSRVDRHEHIGQGQIGLGCFKSVVNHPALGAVPKIMETPKGKTPKGTPLDTLNLRRLKRLMRDGGSASGPARRPTGARRGAATR